MRRARRGAVEPDEDSLPPGYKLSTMLGSNRCLFQIPIYRLSTSEDSSPRTVSRAAKAPSQRRRSGSFRPESGSVSRALMDAANASISLRRMGGGTANHLRAPDPPARVNQGFTAISWHCDGSTRPGVQWEVLRLLV